MYSENNIMFTNLAEQYVSAASIKAVSFHESARCAEGATVARSRYVCADLSPTVWTM